MKKYILFFLFLPSFIFCQDFNSQQIGISGFVLGSTYYDAGITYSFPFEDSSIEAEMYLHTRPFSTGDFNLPLDYFTLGINYIYPVLSDRYVSHILSFGTGLKSGYQILNKGVEKLPNNSSLEGELQKIIVGINLIARYNYVISPNLFLELNLAPEYYFNVIKKPFIFVGLVGFKFRF